jgi:hypothetical protein
MEGLKVHNSYGKDWRGGNQITMPPGILFDKF